MVRDRKPLPTVAALTILLCLLLAAVASGPLAASLESGGTTTRVSVASAGTQADRQSGHPSTSADGRYVAFDSYATNLVANDTNGVWDAFVHDRQTGQTTRVSVSSTGEEANSGSGAYSISADGRYVAFGSSATNLVSGDTNAAWDVFVHDRQTGETTRVSVDSNGTQGDDDSGFRPCISADGRYVAFSSYATNLVPNDTNTLYDIFVHDRETGQTARVSVASDGTQGNGGSHWPSFSASGRYVAFGSLATNLVPNDTNDLPDIFVHDRETGQTTRVSVSSNGAQGDGHCYPDHCYSSISADGRYVAFGSDATNLVTGDTNGWMDIFIHDRETGQTTRVSVSSAGSQGNFGSHEPSISADGRYVAFESYATNLVPDDTTVGKDVFVHDQQTGQTTRVSVSSTGMQGNDWSYNPSISADGRYVAFSSYASNLVEGDTNDRTDVFVHDRWLCRITVYKVVEGDGGATPSDWSFTITPDPNSVGPQIGPTAIFTGLPADTYTINEDGPGGFSVMITGDCNSEGEVTVDPGESKACTFTNAAPGSITVYKVVESNGGATPSDWSFTISPDPNSMGSQSGPIAVFTDLSAGSYIVTEEGPDGFSLVISGDCNSSGQVTVGPGESKACTFTNSEPGTITVYKVVHGDGGATPSDWSFTITPDPNSVGSQSGPTAVFSDLPADTYTITEDGPEGFSVAITGDCNSTGQVTVGPGESKACTFTNTANVFYLYLPVILENY